MNLDQMSCQQRDELAAQLSREILELIDSRIGGQKDPYLLFQKVIGPVLGSRFHERNSLSENAIRWSVDRAVAAQMGPQIERVLRLHAWLVERGYDASSEWDLGYCDRYACYMGNTETFKSLAVRTQSYTYMVVVRIGRSFDETPNYSMDIRLCTASPYGYDGQRVEPSDLLWLCEDGQTAGNSYFRYRDIRDRGYLLSVRRDLTGNGWTAESALSFWSMLTHVVYDLASLIDSIEEGQP